MLLSGTRLDAERQAAHRDQLEAVLEQLAAQAEVGAGEPGRETGRRGSWKHAGAMTPLIGYQA